MSARLTFQSSTRTSVTFNYSTTMTKPSNTSTIRYGTPNYSWSFGRTGSSGSYTWRGWSPGSQESISGIEVTMVCSTQVYTKTEEGKPAVPPEKGEDGKPIPGTGSPEVPPKYEWLDGDDYERTEEANTLVFFTQPSSWSFNLSTYGWTDSWMPASEWNEFVDKIEEWMCWQSQHDMQTNNLRINGSERIGAGRFNRAAQYLNVSIRVSERDRIKISLFDTLAAPLS